MARTDNLNHFLTDVADAIRTKTGGSSPISAESFDTAIENIPSSGGGSPYLVSSIEAMNALQNVNDGDICIVKSTIRQNPTTIFGTKKLYIPRTITYSSEIDDAYGVEYYSIDEMSNLSLSVDPDAALIYYYSYDEDTDTETEFEIEYTTEDHLTYTTELDTYEYDICGTTYVLAEGEEELYDKPSKLITYDNTVLFGIYTFNSTNNNWEYLDINTYAKEDQMLLNNFAYTSNGPLMGTLDIDKYAKKQIVFGTTNPIGDPEDVGGFTYVKIDGSSLLDFEVKRINRMPIFVSKVPAQGSNVITSMQIDFNRYTVSDNNYIYYVETRSNTACKYDKSNKTVSTICTIANSYICSNMILKNSHLLYMVYEWDSTLSNYGVYYIDIDLSNNTYTKTLFKNVLDQRDSQCLLVDTIDDLFLRNDIIYKYNSQTNTFDSTNIDASIIPDNSLYLYSLDKYTTFLAKYNGDISMIDLYNETSETLYNDYDSFNTTMAKYIGNNEILIQKGKQLITRYKIIIDPSIGLHTTIYEGTLKYINPNCNNECPFVEYDQTLNVVYAIEDFPPSAASTGDYLCEISNADFSLNMPQQEGIFIFEGENNAYITGSKMLISDIQVIMRPYNINDYINVVDGVYIYAFDRNQTWYQISGV